MTVANFKPWGWVMGVRRTDYFQYCPYKSLEFLEWWEPLLGFLNDGSGVDWWGSGFQLETPPWDLCAADPPCRCQWSGSCCKRALLKSINISLAVLTLWFLHHAVGYSTSILHAASSPLLMRLTTVIQYNQHNDVTWFEGGSAVVH